MSDGLTVEAIHASPDGAFNLIRQLQREVERLIATNQGAVDLAERYGEAIVAISEALPNVNRVRAIIAGLDTERGR